MQSHEIVGLVLVIAGVLDGASAFWVPSRIRDERQRAMVKVALLSSGFVVASLGGLIWSGVLQLG